MRYFKRIKTDVNVQPLLGEIACHPNPWDISTGRQDKIKVQREAHSIPLRGLVKSKIQDRKRRDVHESRYTTTSQAFPFAREFIESFAAECGGELSRAKLVNLPPGHRVYPHSDRGDYYKVRDRYHLILQTGADGSFLQSGDESVRMRAGELWWFDNKQPHESFNDSTQNRIHLIFDVLPQEQQHRLSGNPLQLVDLVAVA